MPERVVFVLSTGRTGTKTLAEGLAGGDILAEHQPPFSRILTVASNYYLHGWLSRPILEQLVRWLREPQILNANCRYYIQTYSLDYLPAKIISQRLPNVYVIHLVRDPRTFVRSYLNWMHTRFNSFVANKLVFGWHPSGLFTRAVPGRVWLRMNEFQKVCWHWTYKNALLERLFEGDARYKRARFEDLFLSEGTETLHDILTFAGVPYRDGFESAIRQSKNRSRKSYFPAWQEWSVERRQQLLEMCGSQMRHYGYI